MIYTVCFIWFSLFVKAHGNSDRKVNLALETVIKFDQPSLRTDVNFLDKMQKFLTKIKGAINEPDDEEISRRRNQKPTSANQKHLVDYLDKAITIILTYDDEDIKSLAKILNEEIRKYHYKGCKFYELANDKMLRQVVRQLVNGLDSAPASIIRLKLSKALAGLRNTNELDKQLIDFVDSLYSKDSKERLSKVISNLQYYKMRMRADDNGVDNLQKMIGGAMKDLVFDHYTSLNENARRTLKVRINAYLGDLFKHTGLDPNIVRTQPKHSFANLIGIDEISELFKFSTVAEKEKTILRRGEMKARVTKGLMETRTAIKDKYYEPSSQESELRDGSGSSTETSANSLNEETETTTKLTTKKPVKTKKKKKVKTTKSVKVKRFQTKKNSDAMRTIWEEVQTVQPTVPKAVALQPKERIIFEEHNAVINIGSFKNSLRDSSSEHAINLRTGDVKLDVHGQGKNNDRSTDGSEEGLTLEFDGKPKSHKNATHFSARKHNDDVDQIFKMRASKDSTDSSRDSEVSSDKEVKSKVKGKKKPLREKPIEDDDDNDSRDSSVDIGSGGRVTAAPIVDDVSDWDARKLMAKKSQEGSDKIPAETTTKNKFTKISTISLSEEDDKIMPTEEPKQGTPEKNVNNSQEEQTALGTEEVQSDNNKNYFDMAKPNPSTKMISEEQERAAEDFEEIKRRDNSKDDFGNAKARPDHKRSSEQVTTPKNENNSEKTDKKEQNERSESMATQTDHPEKNDASDNHLVHSTKSTPARSGTDLEATTKSSSKAKNLEVTMKTPRDEADEKTTNTSKEVKQTKPHTTENATEEFQDEKLTKMVKELDAATDKAKRRASAENEVKNNGFGMPWDDNEAL